jgi:HD-GYP domain-containing protein (c-di-GMP phosphodiesterase class II)/DNA-binding CsgD family transcriptional regulator
MATLSLATDIGLGTAPEHALRSALLATALAEAAGMGEDEARQAFYLALLRTVGCTGDEDYVARVFGEDAGSWITHMGGASPAEMLQALVRNVGRGDPAPRRLGKVVRAFAGIPGMPAVSRGHCEVGRLLARRLGLPDDVVHGMDQVFERWDGGGVPAGLEGEAIARPVRLAQLAGDAQAAHRLLGTEAAVALMRRRAGRGYDPKLVDLLSRRAPELLAVLDVPSAFDAVLAAEPGPPERLVGEKLETAIRTMGEFADMKSRYTRGHSGGVAALAARAGARLGSADRLALERAGHLHDLGRAGVALAIWDKEGPLTDSEWERIRRHTYFTERILARMESLAPVPALAALAHERLDGSGYHRRLPPAAVPPAARLLAAADAYHAMTERRPQRAGLPPERAAELVRADARAGRLDADAVEAVLAAAGQTGKPPGRREHPAGLTDRELEVLGLLARGLTNKEIASALDISVKTAGHHIEHIFEKAGVTTRAAAALFALQNDLVSAWV